MSEDLQALAQRWEQLAIEAGHRDMSVVSIGCVLAGRAVAYRECASELASVLERLASDTPWRIHAEQPTCSTCRFERTPSSSPFCTNQGSLAYQQRIPSAKRETFWCSCHEPKPSKAGDQS